MPTTSRTAYAVGLLAVPAVLLMAGGVLAQSARPGFGPFLGTWTSTPTPGAPRLVMTWDDWGGGIVYIEVHESTDGNVTPQSVPVEVIAFRQDGKDYPYGVRGGQVASTIASTAVDARTIDVTYKMAGTQVTRARWVVSEDGKTLTLGRPTGSAWKLVRQGLAPGVSEPPPLKSGYKRYIGVWEAVQAAKGATTGSVVWEERGEDFVVATVRDTGGRVTMRYSLKYDGKPYPCNSGGGGSVGTITSVFVDDYKTDWRIFRDGKPGGVGSRIVDPDGQRMVVPARGGGGDRDLIWRRLKDAPTDGLLTP